MACAVHTSSFLLTSRRSAEAESRLYRIRYILASVVARRRGDGIVMVQEAPENARGVVSKVSLNKLSVALQLKYMSNFTKIVHIVTADVYKTSLVV